MKPLPTPTPLTKPFWDGCRAGELRLQRCSGCGAYRFFPAEGCNHCGHHSFVWETVDGAATVYTWIVVHRAVDEHWAGDVPFAIVVGQLNLPGKPLLTGSFAGALNTIEGGMPLRLRFKPVDESVSLLEWIPA